MAYDDDNIFARIIRGEADGYRVFEDSHTVAILDVMPQSDGHTLVLPKAQAENLFDLDPAEAAAVILSTQIVASGVLAAFQPDGIMLSQFNGAAAGQTVFHFHMHIIPRYAGTELRRHGRGMADAAVLETHANKIREVLDFS